jgi:CRP/FNR family transcriptional regulator, nitrogen fixation regulation protein
MLTHSAVPKSAFHPTTLLDHPIPPKPASEQHAEDESLERWMQLIGGVTYYPRRVQIVHEDEAADRLYKVISGTVCTYKVLSDGRRQIGGFYLAGDIFGLECAEGHSLAAETITNAKVLVIRKSVLSALAGRNAALTNHLLSLTARELARVQDRVLLLSSKSAQERVVGFLLEMSKRGLSNGDGLELANSVELPMSRQDIADYLGLTIETVSRTLWALEHCGAITISRRRRIQFRSRSTLLGLQQ